MARSRPSNQPWHINEEEVAYYVDSKTAKTKTSKSYKCYVPKLMPAVDKGVAEQKSEFTSNSCFCNSTKCKPKSKGSVKTANYLTVKTQDNQEFKRSGLSSGSEVKIRCVGQSVDQLTMTNHVDKSTGTKYDK